MSRHKNKNRGHLPQTRQVPPVVSADGIGESPIIRQMPNLSTGERKTLQKLELFVGPLPHPDILQRYEETCPGSSERILQQFEEQGRHRRKLESRALWHNVTSSWIGQIGGFALFGGGIGGSIWLLSLDKPVEGLTALFVAIGGSVLVLAKAQKAKATDLQNKRTPK